VASVVGERGCWVVARVMPRKGVDVLRLFVTGGSKLGPVAAV